MIGGHGIVVDGRGLGDEVQAEHIEGPLPGAVLDLGQRRDLERRGAYDDVRQRGNLLRGFDRDAGLREIDGPARLEALLARIRFPNQLNRIVGLFARFASEIGFHNICHARINSSHQRRGNAD
jgi:hypothetical protein